MDDESNDNMNALNHQDKKQPFLTGAACFWLALFPLLHLGSYSQLTRDKWMLMLIGCGLTLACFLAECFRGEVSPRLRLPQVLGLSLMGWMLLCCLLSPFRASVWWIGASARREGLATQLCYLSLFLIFSCSRVQLRPLLWACGASVVICGAIVLLQRAGANPFGLYPAGRSYATNPEFQGPSGNIDIGTGTLCLLAGLFLAGVFRERGVQRWACVGGLGICVFLIVTMEVQFGLLALGALALWALWQLLPRKWRLPVLLCLIALAVLLVWYWPGGSDGMWEMHEVLHGRPQLSFGSNRLAVWVYSLRLAGTQLLSGSGSDTFEPRFNTFLQEEGLTIPTEQDGIPLPDYFDNPHNEYIAQLIHHGLPGLLLFLALLLCSPVCSRRVCPALLAWAVQAFFSFSVCILAPLFWVTLGMAVSGETECAPPGS